MPSEWFRSAKPTAVVGILRSDVDALLAAAGVTATATLDANTIDEPYVVARADADAAAPQSQRGVVNRILALDPLEVHVDAGLNDIPSATVSIAVGRDGAALAAGASNATASSVIHLLEKYVGLKQLKAKIYCLMKTTAQTGAGDLTNNVSWPDEWVTLFDGVIIQSTRRGTADTAQIVLHLTHFMATLNNSSMLTAQVAPGPGAPLAAQPMILFQTNTGALANPALSMYGAAAIAIGGGPVLQTDFWGYYLPKEDTKTAAHCGVKGFLRAMANMDLFAWEAMARADTGGISPPGPTQRPNTGAIEALDRIEPKGPPTENRATAAAAWDALNVAITGLRTARGAASTVAVTRADLMAVAQTAYQNAGYRYAMPIAFHLAGQALGPFTPGRGFGADIADASMDNTAASSFWEKLVGAYATRYQFAVAPAATYAAVIPFQPLMPAYWQSIAASEIFDWNDDAQTPVPLRGIILTGDKYSRSGAFASGNAGGAVANGNLGASAQLTMSQMSAVYDSRDETGRFEVRALPPWLADCYRANGAYAQNTITPTGKSLATIPATTAANAKSAVDRVVALTPGAANLADAYAISGISREAAAKAAPVWVTSTMYRLAKAIYQQERTRYRSVYFSSRFRYDIAPGSTIQMELPNDRYVRGALLGQQNSTVNGMVLRMTLRIDCENQVAQTDFQVGFVRTEGESRPDSNLYADGHPFWATACLGLPWCDAAWIRARLDKGSSIAPSLLNPS